MIVMPHLPGWLLALLIVVGGLALGPLLAGGLWWAYLAVERRWRR